MKTSIIRLTATLLAVIMITALVPISASAAGANLLSNPGGEASTGWTVVGPCGYFGPVSAPDQIVRTGSGSFAFSCGYNGSDTEIKQTITGLQVGKTYSFSAWCSTYINSYIDNSPFSGTVGIKANGASDVLTTATNHFNWTQLSVTFTATSSSVTVSMFANGTNALASFDDLTLELVSTSTFTEQEIDWLAALVFYEGRGFQSSYCKELIAQVAVNRVNSSKFPNNLELVLKQSGQYGWPTAGQTATLIFSNSWVNHAEYNACKDACYAAARKVASGASVNESGQPWPSNVLYQHSFSNPYAVGTGLYKTYTQGAFKLHFNFG